jgi:hypothetical protein
MSQILEHQILQSINPMHRCKHICNSHKPTHRPKIAKELPPLPPEKNYFLKFPSLLKIFKTATHSRHKNNPTMTAKPTADKDYSNSTDRTPAGNSTYKKLAVQWLNEVQFFNQTFVQVDSFVLRNRQLLIAANR